MQEKNFNDIEGYVRATSDRDQTRTGSLDPLPGTRQLATKPAELEECGFTVIHAQLRDREITSFKDQILALQEAAGHHNFAGFKPQRICSLVQNTIACNRLEEHPTVRAVLDNIAA